MDAGINRAGGNPASQYCFGKGSSAAGQTTRTFMGRMVTKTAPNATKAALYIPRALIGVASAVVGGAIGLAGGAIYKGVQGCRGKGGQTKPLSDYIIRFAQGGYKVGSQTTKVLGTVPAALIVGSLSFGGSVVASPILAPVVFLENKLGGTNRFGNVMSGGLEWLTDKLDGLEKGCLNWRKNKSPVVEKVTLDEDQLSEVVVSEESAKVQSLPEGCKSQSVSEEKLVGHNQRYDIYESIEELEMLDGTKHRNLRRHYKQEGETKCLVSFCLALNTEEGQQKQGMTVYVADSEGHIEFSQLAIPHFNSSFDNCLRAFNKGILKGMFRDLKAPTFTYDDAFSVTPGPRS